VLLARQDLLVRLVLLGRLVAQAQKEIAGRLAQSALVVPLGLPEPRVYAAFKATSVLLVHAGTPVFKAQQVYKASQAPANVAKRVLSASRARLV
jgi:hypothetical protein